MEWRDAAYMKRIRLAGMVLILVLATGSAIAETGDGPATNTPPARRGLAALTMPVRAVYTNYLNIQAALADDSFAGVTNNANAMAATIRKDQDKGVAAEVAAQADAVAGAKDIAEAREAFKALSESLIQFLADHEVRTGSYVEIYCPMAEASWLQTAGEDTANPYFGKSMLHCGTPKRNF